MEFLGIVPLYSPDPNKVRNLVTYLKSWKISAIFYLNSPISILVYDLISGPAEFMILGNQNNEGTAVAYNKSIKYALSQDVYSHVILLDQDSLPDDKFIGNLKLCHSNAPQDLIFCPFDKKNLSESRNYFAIDSLRFRFLKQTKASGMSIPLSLLNGRDFNEDLFVDYVDWAFCWSLRAKGISILECSQLRLADYCLGKKSKIFGYNISVPNAYRRKIQKRSALYYLLNFHSFHLVPKRSSMRIIIRIFLIPCIDILEFLGLIKDS